MVEERPLCSLRQELSSQVRLASQPDLSCPLSVDVSKDSVTVFFKGNLFEVSSCDIRSVLFDFKPSCVFLESTGDYGFKVICVCHDLSIPVYYVDNVSFRHYREMRSSNVKSDNVDARLLLDYGVQFGGNLVEPKSSFFQELEDLLNLRFFIGVVSGRSNIRRTGLIDCGINKPLLLSCLDSQLVFCKEQRVFSEKRLKELLKNSPFSVFLPDFSGVVLLGYLVLNVKDWRRFPSCKHFGSFCGFKLRQYESGSIVKRRVLTKRGSSALRHCLYLSVLGRISSKKDSPVKNYYLKLRGLGKSHFQAVTACSRWIVEWFWKECKRRDVLF